MSQIVVTHRPKKDFDWAKISAAREPIELRADDIITMPSIPVQILSCPSGWQKEKLRGLVEQGRPEYLDIPHHQKELVPYVRLAFPHLKIIASFHGEAPESLDALFSELKSLSPDVIKIVTQAHSSLEGLAMLDFLRRCSSFPLTAFCMGEYAQFTRILGPLFGAFFTYAHADDDEPRAPGQPSLSLLRNTYFFDRMSQKTAPFALIGTPLHQSPSHITHNAIFRRFGYDAVYVKIPLGEQEFDRALALFERLGFRGLSITSPLKHGLSKEKPYNTIFFPHCTDTDGPATCDAIEERMMLREKTICIFGRGGVAHAIQNEASKRGARVTLVGRSDEPRGIYDIAINATPVAPPPLSPSSLAIDMRLAETTPFLQQMAATGRTTISGKEVWIRQAAFQFALWLGPYYTMALPPSKSQTLRAILFATLGKGDSFIENPSSSPDTESMIAACTAFGATISREEGRLRVVGIGERRSMKKKSIDAGNSGIVLRFCTAVATLFSEEVQFTGDASLAKRRSCQALLEGLSQLGPRISSHDGHTPFAVEGPITGHFARVKGSDSQPISALLIALALLPGESMLEVQNAGEKPWVALTIDWLRRSGASVENYDFSRYRIHGVSSFPSFSYTVPGDLSALSYLVALALVRKCALRVTNVDLNEAQPDKKFLEFVRAMGGDFGYSPEKKILYIRGPQELRGAIFDLNDTIDMVTIMATLGTFAEGETILKGAAVAQDKESDRLESMTQELRKMGASITKTPDGLRIRQSKLHPAPLASHGDHRVAMALAVAACGSGFGIDIDDRECVKKSFPDFFTYLECLS
jgi:3-phosphoshikimate 1-carboxyvinyltransferase